MRDGAGPAAHKTREKGVGQQGRRVRGGLWRRGRPYPAGLQAPPPTCVLQMIWTGPGKDDQEISFISFSDSQRAPHNPAIQCCAQPLSPTLSQLQGRLWPCSCGPVHTGAVPRAVPRATAPTETPARIGMAQLLVGTAGRDLLSLPT